MSKTKMNIIEEFSEKTADGVVGKVSFELDDLPDDLKLPSKAWLAKKWRKWKAYERVWDEVCKAHENEERESVRAKLKSLCDPADFIEYLLDFEIDLKPDASNTSKVGGDAKSALLAPLIKNAIRLFKEKKAANALNGKSYSQRQFAESHNKKLALLYDVRMKKIREGRSKLDQISDEIKLGGLSASELELKREVMRGIKEEIRIKPFLPSVSTIEGWIAGN